MIWKKFIDRLRGAAPKETVASPPIIERDTPSMRSRRLLGLGVTSGVAALIGQRSSAAPVVGNSAQPITFDITLSGCAGDGMTDDQPKIQAWLNALASQYPGGCEVALAPGKFYLINSAPLHVPLHFIIRGMYNGQDNQAANGLFFGAGGFYINPALSSGIVMSSASSLKNCKVYRQGLVANASAAQVAAAQAAWAAEAFYAQTNGAMSSGAVVIPLASTAGIAVGMPVTGPGGLGPGATIATVASINPGVSVTMTGAGVNAVMPSGTWFRFGGSIGIQIGYNNSANVIDGVMIVGFRTGIQAFCGQFWIEHVHADCITCFENCTGGDTASIMNCEFLPLYGIATGNAPRPGDAVFYHDGGVTTTLYNVFSIGWLVGFHFANVSGPVAVNCGNESFDGANTVNWLLDGGSSIALHGCHAQGGAIGFFLYNTTEFYLAGCSSASGPSVSGNNVAHFLVEQTTANVYGALIAPYTYANYPQKIPIKFGPGISAVTLAHPVISDITGGPPTVPFIQGSMPNPMTPEFVQGVPYAVVASGYTLALLAYWNGAIIDGTGPIARLTVVMPPHPADRQVVRLWFNLAVTALSVTTSDGSSVGAVTNPAAGTRQEWIYSAAQNKWFG